MRRAWWACAVALCLTAAAAAQADWRARIRAEDGERLARWASGVHAIMVDIQPGEYYDISPLTVRRLLDAQAGPLDARALPGNWRCRNVQIGQRGVFGYPPFECRIRQTPQGLFFEKVSGSQRLSGLLYPDDAQHLVLLGGATVNQEPQRSYRGDGNQDDVVGSLYATGRNRLLLTFTGFHGTQLYELTR